MTVLIQEVDYYLIEIGGYKIFNGGGNIFNYMDYGLSYRKYLVVK